jgi:predicted regulator of Ras-like GTPase activity (Roadblock/LC7/MglB family)
MNKKGGKVINDYSRELRGILLVSIFIMVVPLVFFPKDFGLRLSSSLSLLFALELGWYLLVLFATFSKEQPHKVFLLVLMTFGYRICLGMGLGVLLLVMFSLSLFDSLRLGIYGYMPAFLLQALMAPFVLKSFFVVLIGKTKEGEMKKQTPISEVKLAGRGAESFVPDLPLKPREELVNKRSDSSEGEVRGRVENKLESILHYLREYAGVKAAILVDPEGLVVGENSSDFDPEAMASFARCFKETNDQMLHKMGEKPAERIGIHTPDLWICLNQIGGFTLVVLSGRRTDELLSVRINQSVGMIKKFLTERYSQDVLKAVEV